jgi:hypothetical protein
LSLKVWRRTELVAGSSLAHLRRVTQIFIGWFDEYQHRFCIRNHYLGASRLVTRDISTLVAGNDTDLSPRFVVVSYLWPLFLLYLLIYCSGSSW